MLVENKEGKDVTEFSITVRVEVYWPNPQRKEPGSVLVNDFCVNSLAFYSIIPEDVNEAELWRLGTRYFRNRSGLLAGIESEVNKLLSGRRINNYADRQ